MGKIAFVFSGQGAQYSGMGRSLYENSIAAKEVFDIAEEQRPGTIEQCFNGTKEELCLTINTQPCLFCVDLAAALALKEQGIVPDVIAGFSLGEIPALVFSGVFDIEMGFSLVERRAQWMHEEGLKRNSGMAAVLKLSEQTVCELAGRYKNVFLVNYNCPEQIVVSGDKAELNRFYEDVKSAGGKVRVLPVSGGFHCPFMDKAAEKMSRFLEGINTNNPCIPVYSNFTAQLYSDDIKGLICSQINHPVLWQRIAQKMIEDGVDTFIEVGTGKTLCGLIKKINSDVLVYNVEDKESLFKTIHALGGET